MANTAQAGDWVLLLAPDDKRFLIRLTPGQQHHIEQAKFGAIRYTEPFLNNQHIAEPTLYYLERLAAKADRDGAVEYRDCEGNLLIRLPAGDSAPAR